MKQITLREDLRMIISRYVLQATVNYLLQILRKHGRTDLPSDCRSLMNIYNVSENIESISSGKYKHFGLVSGIIYMFPENLF